MKFGAHFAFEVDGKLDKIGKELVDFSGVVEELAPLMIVERAAANADWKLGSDVIALVAAASVSDGKECCWLGFFCK